jgi:hypothetical protein
MTELHVPSTALPLDPNQREAYLASYFGERSIDSRQTADGWTIDLEPYPSADFYVDPRLSEGLNWWQPGLPVIDVPYSMRDMGGWGLSLNDAWTLAHWAKSFEKNDYPRELAILHVDDHDDLMSPRVSITEEVFVDLCTGGAVDLRSFDSISRAIVSGAIGQGSFLAPLIHRVETTHLRHLCHTLYSDTRLGYHRLRRTLEPDTLLSPGALRPAIMVESAIRGEVSSTYLSSRDAEVLGSSIPAGIPVLVHIDLDYFNNRFNGDSDYQMVTHRHDPNEEAINAMINRLLSALDSMRHQVVSIAVAISPGFFPAEYWASTIDRLREPLSLLASGNGF